MAKIVCVLYDDPADGYPSSYARNDIPTLERYPDGQTLPTPRGVDLNPGELLGSVSGELGLRRFLEEQGHTLIVTSDKDGADSVFERELVDADIVISQPFWPAYLTAERIATAPKLRLAITAGIGSDHVDLQAAIDHDITVTEVTYCNSISVAEHVVMAILSLVRNYIPSYQWVIKDGWNIADCVSRSYDLEGMTVGTVGAGRIGSAVLRRLTPFDVELHYTDRHRLPVEVERELSLTFHTDAASMVPVCDVVTINAPLHPVMCGTRELWAGSEMRCLAVPSKPRCRAWTSPPTFTYRGRLPEPCRPAVLDPASIAGHGVAPQELGHPSCDGLGTLDVQEMADAIDRAVLDVWE